MNRFQAGRQFFRSRFERARGRWAVCSGFVVLGACQATAQPDPPPAWSRLLETPDAALLSVHGAGPEDVWAVGADDGSGPLIQHWNGEAWARLDSGARGDLWWVHVTEAGPVYLGGSDGMVLRYQDGSFDRPSTPDLPGHTVYGIWAAAPDAVYAVGSAAGGLDGFIWYWDGSAFDEVPLPDSDLEPRPGLFKVWGTGPHDVWAVGSQGLVLRGNVRDGFRRVSSGTQATLFTVHAADGRLVIVGGDAGGVLLELEGDRLVDRTPARAPLLQGVSVANRDTVWAVGLGGSLFRSEGDGYLPVDPGSDVAAVQVLHAAWVDTLGQLWTVGGNVLSTNLNGGVLVHRDRP